jgi:phosphate butyryltransferase
MKLKYLSGLIPLAKEQPVRKMVIVNGTDAHSIEAAEQARQLGIAEAIITGEKDKFLQTCSNLNINPDNFELVPVSSVEEAALEAANLANNGTADFIMKGLINSDLFIRAILNRKFGLLPAGGLLGHVAIIENPAYHKLLLVSDVAVIPYPTLAQKIILVNYLIQVAVTLGINLPKVALLAPTEQVLESIPSCVDAAKIKQMYLDGEIKGGTIEGPMAIDVALDKESAAIKNIFSEVAGDADCLLFPNIDAGNIFYKMNSKLCQSEQAAIIVGAKVPVVLSSRGDSAQTKLNSIVLAALMSNQ